MPYAFQGILAEPVCYATGAASQFWIMIEEIVESRRGEAEADSRAPKPGLIQSRRHRSFAAECQFPLVDLLWPRRPNKAVT